jgi:hypothetical protein
LSARMQALISLRLNIVASVALDIAFFPCQDVTPLRTVKFTTGCSFRAPVDMLVM